jgi:hypothetical protein
MAAEAIRIRITPRETTPVKERGSREAFWAAIREPNESDEKISRLEAKLCRRFGPELRVALIRELAAPLHALDSQFFPGSMRDLERWIFRYLDGPRADRDLYSYQFAEAFSRLLEQRQQVLRESPELRRVQTRVAAAAGVTFVTRLAGYASLNLDVVPGAFRDIATAFDNDFDSFRVFLEAFVPIAFAGVFSDEMADKLDFTVTVPPSTEQAFRAAASVGSGVTGDAAPRAPEAERVVHQTSARERAEWLWRLANGSLLVPVVLGLVVMYFSVRMLLEVRSTQDTALKPILDHQLKLLEEDRHRFSLDLARQSSPTPPPPPQLSPTTKAPN